MNTSRRAAITIGALFIITTFTFSIGDGLIQEISNTSNFLENLSINRNRLIIAIFLQLICGMGVVGIAVTIYPIFKLYSEKTAIWYVGIRIIECGIIAVSGLNLLSLLEISKKYSEANTTNNEYLQLIGDSLFTTYHVSFIILALVLSFGALAFYYLLFKSKLIPRFISIWGIIAVILMVAGLVIDMLGATPNIMLYIPMGANELFLGLWLLFKGFNSFAIQNELHFWSIGFLLFII